MEERRKHPRTEINRPAYVSAGGAVMSCVVRNISPEGAAIDVENPAFVPARFRLVMASDATVHDCRVAWIRKNRIGLTFVAAQEAAEEPAISASGAERVSSPDPHMSSLP
jgi:PilZ domain